MKFAFPLPHMMEIKATLQPWELAVTGPDQLRLAQRAEEMGYAMVAVPEHLAVPPSHFAFSGRFFLHSTVAQAALAGATRTIRINSSVTILPLQNPITMAKGLATADWMSGGRMTVTFGLGSLREEFDYFGVPWAERGAIADEYLEAIVALWTQDTPTFEGRYVSFKDIGFDPKPVQHPHLPIWMGGDSPPALRRAARFADGWICSYKTKAEEIPARLDYMKSQPTWRDRSFDVMFGIGAGRMTDNHAPTNDPRSRAGMSAQELVDRISEIRDYGATYTGVPIPQVPDAEAYLDYAQWVMEEVAAKV